MRFVRYTLLSCLLLALVIPAARADDYADGFSTDKASADSYFSSIFWPADIDNPPPRPYVAYVGSGEARGLAFMEYREESAELAYRFGIDPAPAGTLLQGTLRLEVSFPCNTQISQFRPGQLFCTVSGDGLAWSAPRSLAAGPHEIPIQSAAGVCYVLFTGARAVIDNLRVSVPGASVLAQANSGPTDAIFHVDGQTGRDTNDGLSRRRAFATVKRAIEEAQNGDAVVVWPGVYQEEVTFKSKAITVQSAADAAVLKAPDGYAVSFWGAESSKSVLANFVITGCGVGAIYCDGTSPTLRNLTITGNPAGIVAYSGANPYIINCILWGNTVALSAWKANFDWRIYYSCRDQGAPDKTRGNINTNPSFADLANGDYHLRSRWGRYVARSDTWSGFDLVTSPCINAGDPQDGPRAERSGSKVNMGAHGGTPFASLSNEPRCP
jgi:hypothetical protein